MARYRALLFGNPIAAWRGAIGLAMIDLVEAGLAEREPDTGIWFSDAGTTIARADGDEPMTEDQDLWAQAMELDQNHRLNAARTIRDRIDALAQAEDSEGASRLREVRRRHDTLLRVIGRNPNARRRLD